MSATLPPGGKFGLLQTIRYVRDPVAYLGREHRQFGDLFTARLFGGAIVVAGAPTYAQEVFTADPDSFAHLGDDAMRPVVGDNSLLVIAGARHRRERRLLMPAFHGERMRAYADTIRGAALAAAARWTRGATFAFQDTTQWISLEVIIRAVFGVTAPANVEAVRAAVLDFVAAINPVVLAVPFLYGRFFPPYVRLRRTRQRLDALLDQEIAARRARPAEERQDILALMLAARHEDGSEMRRDEVCDELATLLFAGHETSGIALAWAIYWLLRSPACLERLLAELDAAGDEPDAEVIARLPYLDAVVQETLRLHPIVPDIWRLLVRPITVGGYLLPAGIGLTVATALIHTHPELYPDPHRFDPERFLGRRFSPFEFTPFGGGARRCLGAAFATYEIKLVLSTLLRRFRLALAEPGEVRPARRTVVLGPATGVRVTYEGPRA